MKLTEKLALETAASGHIHLHREGLFWKAYEQSAVKFIRTIAAYQINTRYVKHFGREIISLGFPHRILDKVLENRRHEQPDEKHIRIESTTLDDATFLAVKQKYVPPSPSPLVSPQPGTLSAVRPGGTPPGAEKNSGTTTGAEVLDQLRRYNIAAATPVDCMNFLVALKSRLDGECRV